MKVWYHGSIIIIYRLDEGFTCLCVTRFHVIRHGGSGWWGLGLYSCCNRTGLTGHPVTVQSLSGRLAAGAGVTGGKAPRTCGWPERESRGGRTRSGRRGKRQQDGPGQTVSELEDTGEGRVRWCRLAGTPYVPPPSLAPPVLLPSSFPVGFVELLELLSLSAADMVRLPVALKRSRNSLQGARGPPWTSPATPVKVNDK